MTILDRYITFTYLRRLISVFAICMVIFVIQTFWLYIDELAGKGLDFITIFRFLLYFSPRLVPLVLPLSVILASLMTFGTFAENYEFVAMKSSGVSLKRPLIVLVLIHIVLGLGALLFANHVIPSGEAKSYSLRRNLAKMKPALAIREGIFNEVGIYNIKVERKHGENEQLLEDIIIHQYHPEGKNNLVIKATHGELNSKTTDDYLQLILYDGNRYEDVEPSDFVAQRRFPHSRVNFDKYIMNIDISYINNVDLYEEESTSNYRTYQIELLKYHIDSLKTDMTERMNNHMANFTNTSTIGKIQEQTDNSVTSDTIPSNVLNFIDPSNSYYYGESVKRAQDELRSNLSNLQLRRNEFRILLRWLNSHIITLHDKYALSFSVIFLFLIGGSLGAIIRKGGIGLPFVLSIFLFLTYHYIGMFTKNAAEDGSINPVLGSWISTIIVAPFAYLLSNRASSDKEVFDITYFYIRLRVLLVFIPNWIYGSIKKLLHGKIR